MVDVPPRGQPAAASVGVGRPPCRPGRLGVVSVPPRSPREIGVAVVTVEQWSHCGKTGPQPANQLRWELVQCSSSMATPPRRAATPEAQLRAFIAKFSPDDQRRIRAVRTAMRKRLPTANELVWDNYNFFVIGYSPTERPTDAVLSMAARANGIGLCFIYGAGLPDPACVLEGSGRQSRFVRVDSAARLSDPDVSALIDAAVARARTPYPASGKGRLIIRSVSAKQRPRRRA